MIKISPSILSADFSRLGDEVKKLEASGADMIHIDVMDGHFVPNITIGPLVLKALRPVTPLPFDVHLMISNPDKYIDSFIDAGADIITVHAEGCHHLHRIVQSIRQKGKKAAVALNPATPLSELDWVLPDLDMVLIMTVNPGYPAQKYTESMTEKIRAMRNIIRERGLDTDIQIDGGIDLDNIHRVTEAGANVIVSGSAVFNAPDAGEFIRLLREKACKG